ncbi:DUF6505 family protein (plasmid) [Microvirga terrae]|uniref:DUF6505 family protein n=1 Tax=Microvirga terrae TaxID=2740529 RepID=A0ABY5RYU1_9HYPH|nr:DUF6505 family protein [Microvirga terrae]UVF22178.1 DUF6505 family protein [Microvirga terrae]
MTLKLPRTIRLDASDTKLFERASEPGEWAVTGSFMFWDVDIANLAAKQRAAFRNGFLGVPSFGFSTLVAIADATQEEYNGTIEALARYLHETLNAPDLHVAFAVATAETSYASSLCRFETGTIITMHRSLTNDQLKEEFRAPRKTTCGVPGADRMHAMTRAFEAVEIDESPDFVDLGGSPVGRRL